jgi:hypothetical protein
MAGMSPRTHPTAAPRRGSDSLRQIGWLVSATLPVLRSEKAPRRSQPGEGVPPPLQWSHPHAGATKERGATKRDYERIHSAPSSLNGREEPFLSARPAGAFSPMRQAAARCSVPSLGAAFTA